ncbi:MULTISPECIES: nicotinate-nucleotide adenylyltransferase [Aerococcus]|uniref:Probable nicotinate-nucleotide adenylyltransferase n=2 Tax=Aerococcus TaxID=1375 RepID=A0A178HGS6_9LACT|nr:MULTISPECIES: nicotinate-nucleotide adenylyltransferase [Aerococcus]KAA9220145.1 nicotinate-nucleotide adenylyltransferase [Aerococcus loyolae]KAA9266331.1 nicotinate-nucleotide adenylyltransferase [Aerococcus loyolae]MCY3025171.1 nicotinate-nucleotide adenylyltransferase [Aerococcus loyolae]MCY3027173.1 nicotinate-nucleotide adenylyltransferase [Aerococcus loyolae]MCY3029262.1 nicotinate-nucleotide adenylyltransferase [Aerococcus loyolae]
MAENRQRQGNYSCQVLEEAQESSSPKKRIGLLGGTFNPIHQGHLMVAEQVYEKLCLDRVDFMPSNLPPHVEHKETIAADKRLAMLNLAIQANDHFAIEKIELDRPGKSYTYDTMDILTTLHPDNEYYFIIGGDMVENLPKWYRVEELMQLCHFVGVQRPGYDMPSDYNIIYVDSPQIDISSSYIRQSVNKGSSIRYLLPEAVRDYIDKEGLYRD